MKKADPKLAWWAENSKCVYQEAFQDLNRDLNVAGMVRNRRLARAVADAGFGTARRMLGYKTAWHGGRLILADRWYPSSKTCSACGTVKAKLSLSEPTFTCQACGKTQERGTAPAERPGPPGRKARLPAVCAFPHTDSQRYRYQPDKPAARR